MNHKDDLRGPALLAELERMVQEGKYDVLIIDPLMEAYPVKDENDNTEANTQMLACRRVAQRTRAAVITVHNSGIKSRKGKFKGRGASSRVDRADVSMNFMILSETDRLIQVTKARGSNLNDSIKFRFAGDLGYELIESSSSDPAMEVDFQMKTLETVREEASQGRHEVERKTFMVKLGIQDRSSQAQALDRALSRNIVNGSLARPRKGVYALRQSV